MHDLRLIHTDLKPENILLVSAESIRVPDYKVVTVLLNCPLCFCMTFIGYGLMVLFQKKKNLCYRISSVIPYVPMPCGVHLWLIMNVGLWNCKVRSSSDSNVDGIVDNLISFVHGYFFFWTPDLQWRFLYDHPRTVLSSRTFQNLVQSSWLILGVRHLSTKTTIMWCQQDITVHPKLSLVYLTPPHQSMQNGQFTLFYFLNATNCFVLYFDLCCFPS